MSSDIEKMEDPSLTDLEDQHDSSPKNGESGLEKSPEVIQPGIQTHKSEFTPGACLVLLGSFSVFFCTVGFINAFGVFEEYYAEHQLSDKSPSTISWLGSFNIFIMFAGTFPVGYLNDKYGHATLLRVGSVVTVFALFMTSLCKEYYQFFLAQALLMGIGIAIVMLPAFAVVPRHFVRNRSAALGICVSGSSLGGVIWPIVLRNVLYKVGFGWGVRISAFIMLPLLATACLTIRLPHDQANLAKPKPDLTLVKNLTLVILAVGLFFIILGLFSPFFYMTTYMVSLNLDTSMAFYIVSIINATSLFGRIIPGIFADRIGPFNVLIFAALSSGITCACWTKATSLAGIIVLSAVYGFTSGAVISLQTACVASLVKPQQIGLAVGFVMGVISIAGLIGSPINGQLLGAFSYLGLSLFSGLSMLIGMTLLIIARLRINSRIVAKA